MAKQDYLHVPYGCTVHGEEEIAAVVDVLRGSTQMGKHVALMEQKIAALFAKRHGIMLNSGSSANYLGIEILNLPKGSQVITPVLTFATTVAPLVKHGLIPAFVDVAPGTYNIDVNQVEAMINANTTAMMIPNLLGNLPDWRRLKALADQYGLLTFEDSADTLGATIDGVSSGHFSDVSITSFYGSHVINCAGNGGMLCVNHDAQARMAKLLRSWGRSSSLFVESEAIENRFNVEVDGIAYDAKFVFEELGYNLEPNEAGAAFGLVQLSKLPHNVALRETHFATQMAFFQAYADWFTLPKTLENARTGWLAFPLTLTAAAPFSRTELQIFFENHNIQTRTVFTGNILRQPGFKHIDCQRAPQGYPEADHVMRGGILLACHHGMTDAMMAHIHQTFSQFAARYL